MQASISIWLCVGCHALGPSSSEQLFSIHIETFSICIENGVGTGHDLHHCDWQRIVALYPMAPPLTAAGAALTFCLAITPVISESSRSGSAACRPKEALAK